MKQPNLLPHRGLSIARDGLQIIKASHAGDTIVLARRSNLSTYPVEVDPKKSLSYYRRKLDVIRCVAVYQPRKEKEIRWIFRYLTTLT